MTEETEIVKPSIPKIEIKPIDDVSSSDEEIPTISPENKQITDSNNVNQSLMDMEIPVRRDKRGRIVSQKKLQGIHNATRKQKEMRQMHRDKAEMFDKLQHLVPEKIDYDKIVDDVVAKLKLGLDAFAPKPVPALATGTVATPAAAPTPAPTPATGTVATPTPTPALAIGTVAKQVRQSSNNIFKW